MSGVDAGWFAERRRCAVGSTCGSTALLALALAVIIRTAIEPALKWDSTARGTRRGLVGAATGSAGATKFVELISAAAFYRQCCPLQCREG